MPDRLVLLPAVADLDADGLPDVVWGAYDVVALNGADGSLKWRAPNGNRVWPGVAVADLTGDGTLEVIAGRGSDLLTVYDRFGAPIWSVNPFGSGEVRTLAVEDLEFDGQFDIVVGRASGGATRQLNAFTPAGAQRAGWPARHDGEPGYGWGMYNQNVTVADLDGDGTREVIGPTDTHYITAAQQQRLAAPREPGLHRSELVGRGGRARGPPGGRARLRELRRGAPAQLRRFGAGDRRRERRRPGRDRRRGKRLQLRHLSLHEPLPDAVHPEPRPHALERQRLRLDGHPAARARQRAPGGGLQRHRERAAQPGGGRPRRRRSQGDPVPVLRRQAPRVLAGQDRARKLALRRARRRHPLRGRARGGRPRRGRPGGGPLHLVAAEGGRGRRTAPRAQLPRRPALRHRPARVVPGRQLERRPDRARAGQHRRRRRPGAGGGNGALRRGGLRPARTRPMRACCGPPAVAAASAPAWPSPSGNIAPGSRTCRRGPPSTPS